MTNPPTALLSLTHVRREFAGGRVALADVSLSVGDGEFVSLLGASGCGKSTVLRLLSGLDVPTSGTIARNLPADAVPGYVFQDAALMPWASVRRNVELPLMLRGGRAAAMRERVDSALRAVGLADSAGAVPRELSGGMKMRASLARALVTSPRLWLLDEPFGALDEITRFALNQTLLSLCQPRDGGAPATAVFVTHSVYEAVFLSQRVLVMARPGRVVDDIAIDVPYPRDAGFRATPQFAALCARVSDALQRASAVGAPA
ncbi:ABC transporter ATP-binding protein [Scleromatobacter humisilvae]|uniref:ABC transporter ATP-binding protein n=1 Tax=Scleromatobacter humisilvae TaxID=2897159 RepID=A0A9X1YQ51_9BURK|nr:ABC transporter ATP-binding protein [Scleromatobacter humisilvae]MCK9685806.1 ABC transporter ATP-binding protein [Scleromatobacter humisilvae]